MSSPNEKTGRRSLPSSKEVSAAAFDSKQTLELVQRYDLSAVEISQLIDNLSEKPVPW